LLLLPAIGYFAGSDMHVDLFFIHGSKLILDRYEKRSCRYINATNPLAKVPLTLTSSFAAAGITQSVKALCITCYGCSKDFAPGQQAKNNKGNKTKNLQ
jgi:hypothetical protein